MQMSLGLYFALFLNAAAWGATCPEMRSFRNAALLVGVSNTSLSEGPSPLRFAGADADLLQKAFENQFGAQNVFKLRNADATSASVSSCLDSLARFAQPGGKVVIFISARGFSSSQMDDGYVLTSDAAIDKLPRAGAGQAGNGISIQTLRRKVGAMQAREKYLLLDLCREPAETPLFENLIYNRILDKRFLDVSTRQIVLASSPGKRSLESEATHSGNYAHGLADTLKPGVDLEKLFAELKVSVQLASRKKQTPSRPASAPGDGWKECPFCRASRINVGPLLASVSQEAPPLSPPSPAEARELTEAIREEEKAQRVFVRYGEGDHFPGDPFHQCENPDPEFGAYRLCREEYDEAAGGFERAANLRESIRVADVEGNRVLVESLKERGRFCRAQARMLAGDSATAAGVLGDAAGFQFAESHNLLGIALLEQGKYAEAEAQFELAIRKSPHWAYPRHNLALAYIEHGNYSAAENEYREAIRSTPAGSRVKDPENACFHGRGVTVAARPYLYYNLGVLLQRVNRLSEARREYCMAEAAFRLRLDLLNAGPDREETGALAGLRAKAAIRNLADVSNSLGVLFEAARNSKKAPEQFQEALRRNPDLMAAHFNLARMGANEALARRDTARARRLYQEVLDQPGCRGPANDFGCQAAKAAMDKLPR